MTEHWWRESPFNKGQMGHGSALSEIWCKHYNEAVGLPEEEAARTQKWIAKAPAFIFVNPRPPDDFKGASLRLIDSNILRWVTVFQFPSGRAFISGRALYACIGIMV
jgi:hypothetical protein